MAEMEGWDEVLETMPEPERQRFLNWWRSVSGSGLQDAAEGRHWSCPHQWCPYWQALIVKAWAVRAALQPVNRTLVQDTLQQERKRFEPLLRVLREAARRHDQGGGDRVDAVAWDWWQLVPSDIRIDGGQDGSTG